MRLGSRMARSELGGAGSSALLYRQPREAAAPDSQGKPVTRGLHLQDRCRQTDDGEREGSLPGGVAIWPSPPPLDSGYAARKVGVSARREQCAVKVPGLFRRVRRSHLEVPMQEHDSDSMPWPLLGGDHFWVWWSAVGGKRRGH